MYKNAQRKEEGKNKKKKEKQWRAEKIGGRTFKICVRKECDHEA